MARRQRDKMLIGLAGEYHVASELSRLGYYAAITSKNYPGTDILAVDENDRAVTSLSY